MTQLDFAKLASQGRAFDATRAWTENELASLLDLEKNAGQVDDKGNRAGLDRVVAAEYVRNGITTVEAYDKAVGVGFEVKSLETVREEAVAAHQAEVRSQLGLPEEESEEEESEEDESTEESEDESEEDESEEDESEEEEEEAPAPKKDSKKSGKGKATNK